MTTFEGDQLEAILASQTEPVQIRHPKGHVEIRYARASDAIPLVRDGGYFGVGHRKRIKYVQPYSIDARKEPWGKDLGLSAAIRRPPRVFTTAGKGCLGRRCVDSTLHTAAADPAGRAGVLIRRI
jgi:hypothetical protein